MLVGHDSLNSLKPKEKLAEVRKVAEKKKADKKEQEEKEVVEVNEDLPMYDEDNKD